MDRRRSDSAQKEIAAAQWPMIRHIKVQNDVGAHRKKRCCKSDRMESATAVIYRSFTAVGYYFARKLYQELQIPIGLINLQGGTDVETWTSREAFEIISLKDMIAKVPILIWTQWLKPEARINRIIYKVQGGLPDAGKLKSFRGKIPLALVSPHEFTGNVGKQTRLT